MLTKPENYMSEKRYDSFNSSESKKTFGLLPHMFGPEWSHGEVYIVKLITIKEITKIFTEMLQEHEIKQKEWLQNTKNWF